MGKMGVDEGRGGFLIEWANFQSRQPRLDENLLFVGARGR